MALTVGELVAFIRADGTQFDRTIDSAGQKFAGLKSGIETGMKTVAAMFTGAVASGGALATSLFLVGTNYNRLQQTSRAALGTILGGAEAANAQMDKLDDFAKNSPFAKQVFITAQQQLLGFGVEAGKVLPTLDAIQNAVAATGGSGNEILALTDIFAKVQSSAKITGEDLNRFGTYGVDAASMIGSRMGKTGQEIREKITEGTLDAGEALDALAAGMQEKFGGATANIKQQFDGAADRIKGAWRDIGGIIAAPFIDPHGGGMAVEWANKVADALRALEQKAKPLADLLLARLKPGFDAITPALDSVRGAINNWDLSKVNGQIDALTKYAPLIAPVAAGLAALGGAQILGPLSRLVPGLNPVVASLAALVAVSPGLRAGLGEFLRALEPLAPVAADLSKVLADSLLGAMDKLTPALAELMVAGAHVAVALGTSLAPAVVAVAEGLVPVAGVVADVVSWMAQLPSPVLAVVGVLAAFRALGVAAMFQGASAAVRSFHAQLKSSEAVRAYQAGLSPVTAALVGVNSVAGTARAGIGRLGNALKTAFLSNPIGLAITGISAAIAVFAANSQAAREAAQAFRSTLDELGNTTASTTEHINRLLTDTSVSFFTNMLDGGTSMIDMLDKVGVAAQDAVGYIEGNEQAVRRVNEALEAYREGGNFLEETFGARSASIQSVTDFLDAQADGLRRTQDEQKRLSELMGDTSGSERATDATKSNTDATKSNTDAVRDNISAQREAAGSAISLREAQLQAEDQQQRFTEAVQRSAEVNADAEASEEAKAAAVRDVEQALLTTVRGYDQTTEAMGKNNASAAELDNTIRKQREQFIQNAIQMGYNEQEARELATAYGLIPNRVLTELIADATNANKTIDTLIQTYNGRTIRLNVALNDSAARGWKPYVGGGNLAMAQGGVVEYYRDGAVRGLNPMSPVAQIVGPNTWRVIGDRPRDDEAYIPINQDVRSLAILDETAKRMGKVVVPMASGGFANPAGAPASNTPPAGVQVNLTINSVPTNNAEESARVIMRTLRHELRGGRIG